MTSSRKSELSRRQILSAGAVVAASQVGCSTSTQAGKPAASGGAGTIGEGGAGGTQGGQGGTGQGGVGQGGIGQGGTPGGGGGVPNMCSLTPQQTEGPFYVDDDLVRQDVTEGRPGIGLRVVINVVTLPDCTPLADTPVDIWHCDAAGVYSGYPGQLGGIDTTGETFLRGTQITDADGRVEFHTIYPGWYPGRSVHIHFKARLAGNMEVTSQLYFSDAQNDAVMVLSPYDAHTPYESTNAGDSIFAGTTNNSTLVAAVVEDGDGYLATLTIGVQ